MGAAYTFINDLMAVSIVTSKYARFHDVGTASLLPNAGLAVVMMFYPLSGFIADVCCGRFKTVMVSLSFIFVSFLFAMIASSFLIETLLS